MAILLQNNSKKKKKKSKKHHINTTFGNVSILESNCFSKIKRLLGVVRWVADLGSYVGNMRAPVVGFEPTDSHYSWIL